MLAQSDEAAATGVARISDVHGNLAIRRGDDDAAVEAVVNAPVLAADPQIHLLPGASPGTGTCACSFTTASPNVHVRLAS